MKKKLLVLAIAGAFVAPVAMADTSNVTVYGQANVSYANVRSGDGGGVSSTNTSHISSEASRVGVKGSEDLGGGTSAIWQIESQVNIDNSATASSATGASGGALGTRNTFAGLKGESWGSLVLGRNDSTYKSAFRGLDMFADTVADNRSVMGLSGSLDTRSTNSVTYASPEMSGFKIGAQFSAAAETAKSGDTKGSIYDISAEYNAGPITAALAWNEYKAGSAGSGDAAAVALTADDRVRGLRLGGGYKMDQFAVNAIYEQVRSDVTFGAGKVDSMRNNAFYIAGKYNISASDAVKLAFTNRGSLGDGAARLNDSRIRQFSVGYDHAMSKRTTVYALYSKINNDNNSTGTFGNPDATTATAPVGGAGADPSAFALGMKHSF